MSAGIAKNNFRKADAVYHTDATALILLRIQRRVADRVLSTLLGCASQSLFGSLALSC